MYQPDRKITSLVRSHDDSVNTNSMGHILLLMNLLYFKNVFYLKLFIYYKELTKWFSHVYFLSNPNFQYNLEITPLFREENILYTRLITRVFSNILANKLNLTGAS